MFRIAKFTLLISFALLLQGADSYYSLADRACTKFQAQYITETECSCDIYWRFKTGMAASTKCDFTDSFTIAKSGMSLKGTPSLRGEYTLRSIRQTEVFITFEKVNYTINLPDPAPDVVVTLQPANLTITATHGEQLAIESCNVTYGSEPCKKCEPCGDYGIMFDCSNINLYNATYPVYLPFDSELCVGLGAPLSLDGEPNSVKPFDPNQAV